MYVPPAFKDDDLDSIRSIIRDARLASLVTATAEGPIATPLPFFLEESEGEYGTLYGHLARANPQWKLPPVGEALAIFNGPEAYVTPSWYATKQETGKVVPTWNYIAVHAYAALRRRDDPEFLRPHLEALTRKHESSRPRPWHVSDAPADFIDQQMKAIVGVELRIDRLEGKWKMSQNRSSTDIDGVVEGLGASPAPRDQAVASIVQQRRPAKNG